MEDGEWVCGEAMACVENVTNMLKAALCYRIFFSTSNSWNKVLQHFKSLVSHHGGFILWDFAGHCLVLLNVKFLFGNIVANDNTKIPEKYDLFTAGGGWSST